MIDKIIEWFETHRLVVYEDQTVDQSRDVLYSVRPKWIAEELVKILDEDICEAPVHLKYNMPMCNMGGCMECEYVKEDK